MSKPGAVFLTLGLLIFIALLMVEGTPAILATLGQAGWGLVPVAAFHVIPLVLDAAAIRVLFCGDTLIAPLRRAVLCRWMGESANSLMPAGQIGGPVVMARQLMVQGLSVQASAAAITVSTTLQTFAQIAFALIGASLLWLHARSDAVNASRHAALVASGVLVLQVGGFYLLQRRGLFGKVMRTATRFSGKRDWSLWLSHAESIDAAVDASYRRSPAVAASFLLSLIGWLVGTGEVILILSLVGHPVSTVDALLLESLGQAIRGAAFAIPGALGVQEGGYVLLAPLVGLPPDIGLALSLAKRARELLLGVPGLIYLRFSRRGVGATTGSAVSP